MKTEPQLGECPQSKSGDCTDTSGKTSSAGIHGNRLKEDTTTLQGCQQEFDQYIAPESKR